MSLRPPSARPPRSRTEAAADLIQYEAAQEAAAALGRLGRRLEVALAALAALAPDAAADRRSALRSEAAHALWLLAVQREACGLRDLRAVVRDYGVPAEVVNRMGPPAA